MSGGRTKKLSKSARKKIDELMALFDRPTPSLRIYEGDCIEGDRILREGIEKILKSMEAGG